MQPNSFEDSSSEDSSLQEDSLDRASFQRTALTTELAQLQRRTLTTELAELERRTLTTELAELERRTLTTELAELDSTALHTELEQPKQTALKKAASSIDLTTAQLCVGVGSFSNLCGSQLGTAGPQGGVLNDSFPTLSLTLDQLELCYMHGSSLPAGASGQRKLLSPELSSN